MMPEKENSLLTPVMLCVHVFPQECFTWLAEFQETQQEFEATGSDPSYI
jgi:hypothetical protein